MCQHLCPFQSDETCCGLRSWFWVISSRVEPPPITDRVSHLHALSRNMIRRVARRMAEDALRAFEILRESDFCCGTRGRRTSPSIGIRCVADVFETSRIDNLHRVGVVDWLREAVSVLAPVCVQILGEDFIIDIKTTIKPRSLTPGNLAVVISGVV